ncbi:MAG TPA: hypothetical protein DHV14_10350 [Micrococcales bacterium]|uniref:AsnC family protein n=1 Tax=Miniimonas arenae TaxID=676201 RepID=A0A5C5BCH4_9MICO|nr:MULTISPECIES: hypothetical protein [Miniimonas]TNU73925.1 hypothetical protein FH969_08715 [Miniimonas arenae]HCX85510.1 hypothetical protein [Micrococcales bacterium]
MASKHTQRLDRAAESVSSIKDPLARLAAARAAREQFEKLEIDLVRSLRKEGTTWRTIGEVYGLTKQGAQQRFRSADS